MFLRTHFAGRWNLSTRKRSDKIYCPSKPVNRHLFGYQSDQLWQFHSYRSDLKIWGMIIFFPSFTYKNFAGDKRNAWVETWFKGKDLNTENVIDILTCITNWRRIFSNTYYTKHAFQTPLIISSCIPIVEMKAVFLNEPTFIVS